MAANRDSPGEGTAALPVIVTESFVLHRAQVASFEDHCRSVRDAALHDPACTSFRVLNDRHHPDRIVLLSEWQSAESFNAFVRTGGLLWLERGMHPPLVGVWSFLHPRAIDGKR